MEFTTEFIEANGLSEDQVKAVAGYFDGEVLPTLKQEWDGKANANAEGILDGASKYAQKLTGLALNREKGEKFGDFLVRITDSSLETAKKALEDKQAEIQAKLDNFKGGEQFKAEIDALKGEKDSLLQKVAELEPLAEYKEKYDTASETLVGLKRSVAFGNVKPVFPESVNKYEAKAKWDEFVKSVDEKFNVEIVDGEPIAIDKENPHKQIKLANLVEQDENIAELLKGRQQNGNGATSKNLIDVEGVPFKVPENATSEDKSKLVREHLAKEGIGATHPEYGSKFSELYAKISQAKAA